jgi:hypothetical protein
MRYDNDTIGRYAMNINGFCTKNRINIKSEYVDENKNNPGWKDANHFKFTLKMKGKQFTSYFSKGYGLNGEPTAPEVLDCLASDAMGVEWDSFEGWCNNYGYDTDSRKAEKTYQLIESQSKKLENFLGEDLYEMLLHKIERL